ncbi:MAG: YkgJ family cysteine cluster protein [bacterium]
MPPTDHEGVLEPLPETGLRFSCHPSVPCFNVCCRDLRLTLTPYDILRMKKAAGLPSSAFLEQYTFVETDPEWKIPVIRLQMSDDPVRSCPFVRAGGCSIYADRPAACRTYPLGRASRRGPDGTEEHYFMVREAHCLGFREGKLWTVPEWLRDQGLATYNEWTDRWMGFLSTYRPGARDLSEAQWKMFYMGCYSLDRFREFAFGTRLLSLVEISEERLERLRRNEEALLSFALQWLAFSIFGEPVLKLRRASLDDARP